MSVLERCLSYRQLSKRGEKRKGPILNTGVRLLEESVKREREREGEGEKEREMTLYRRKGKLTFTLSGICRRYCITPFASSQKHFTAWVL